MALSPQVWRLAGQQLASHVDYVKDRAPDADPAEPAFIPGLRAERGGNVTMMMLMGPPEAMLDGALAQQPADRWAMVSDGRVRAGDKALTEAIVVRVGEGDARGELAVPYQRPFALGSLIAGEDVDRAAVLDGIRASFMVSADGKAALEAAVQAPMGSTAVRWTIAGAELPTADGLEGRFPGLVIDRADATGVVVHGPGAVRGVRLLPAEGRVDVDVPTGASAEDLLLGVDLATWLAAGRPVLQGGVPVDLAQRDRTWARAHERACYEQLYAAIADGARVGLMVRDREVSLGARSAAAAARAPEPALELRSRLRALGEALDTVPLASVMRVSVPGGQVRVTGWAKGLPALLDATADLVVVDAADGSLNVTVDALAEVLGADATWYDDRTLGVPAFDDGAWASLTAALRPYAVADLAAAARGTEPAPPALTAWTPEAVAAQPSALRDALIVGYAAVLLLVMGADGDADAKEKLFLARWATEARKGGTPAGALLRDVDPSDDGGMKHLIAAMRALLEAGDPLVWVKTIVTSVRVLDAHVAAPQRDAYTDELRALGRRMAEASNGSWLAFWRPSVSAEEKRALELIEQAIAAARRG